MSNGSMVQWFKWRLGRFRTMGGIYVAFLSHFRFIPTLFCSSQHVRFFLIISSRSLFWAVSAECIWACFCLGFSTAIWVSWFCGVWGVWGGFGYVLTVYADAIHDIKMRFMSRCFWQCVASQPAWFSTASAVHLLPPRLAFSSAIIMSLGGKVTGDRLI
jgi:hypothetical protein